MLEKPLLTLVELFKPFASFKVEFGEYILLSISMGSIRVPEYPSNWKNEPHHGGNSSFYWNVENKIGFTELEIGNPSGIFIDFRVVQFLGQFKKFIDIANDIQTRRKGIPNFSLSLWKLNDDSEDISQNIFYNVHDIEIQLGEDSLRVKFWEDEIKHIIEISERIALELNTEKQLCSIMISNINPEERDFLIQYEASHQNHQKHLKK